MVSAPLVEEARQGRVRARRMLLWRRGQFDGVIDGIVYAGFCAAGFAFTENIYYFGRVFAEHGFGTVTTAGVGPAFILRGVLSPFTHPLFTVMIGDRDRDRRAHDESRGCGCSRRSPGTSPRSCCTPCGTARRRLAARTMFLNVYFLIMVPIFIAAVLLIVAGTGAVSSGSSPDMLPAMVRRRAGSRRQRWPAGQPERPACLAGRGAQEIGACGGAGGRRLPRRRQRTGVPPARHQAGHRRRDATKREAKLVDVLRVNRARAMRGTDAEHAL